MKKLLTSYKSKDITDYKKYNRQLEEVVIERESEELDDYDLINEQLVQEIYRNTVMHVLHESTFKTAKEILNQVRQEIRTHHQSRYIKKNLPNLEKMFKDRISRLIKLTNMEHTGTEKHVYRKSETLEGSVGNIDFKTTYVFENEIVSEVRCYPIVIGELDIECIQRTFHLNDTNFPVEIFHGELLCVVDFDGTIFIQTKDLKRKEIGYIADRVNEIASEIYHCLR